jgi:hypothetical protein
MTKKLNLNEYNAQEANCLLTKILYVRIKATDEQWRELQEDIEELKSNIFNGK